MTLLALSSDDLASATPAAPRYALLVEGDGTELLRLDASFGVIAQRHLSGRYAAALSAQGQVLAVQRTPADASPGGPSYQALRLGLEPEQDITLALSHTALPEGALRRVAAGDHALFVWTDGRRPPVAFPLRVFPSARGAAALRFEGAHTLSPSLDLDDARAVQVLGLAIDATRYAAIVRVGAAEGADSQVWLATHGAQVPVDALEDAADIEAMAWVGDEVWAIATFEFSRPLLLHIAASGELSRDPVELRRDAALPPALAGGDPARLLEAGSTLLLRRRNAMGDPLRPDHELAARETAGLPADVIREGARYLVVYQERDAAGDSWPLRVVSLDCSAR